MVAKNTTDTLTNKSMSGSQNTFTNLPHTAFSAMTSAQLAAIVSDETGSGALVFATSPTLVTPVLGVATATSLVAGSQATVPSGVTAGVVSTVGTSFATSSVSLTRAETTASGVAIFGYKSNGTPGTPTVVADDDILMEIRGYGYDGSSWEPAAAIRIASDGTPGNSDMPGSIEFLTTADGSASMTSRLTIAADGVGTWVNGVKFSGSGPTNTTLNHYAEVSSTVATTATGNNAQSMTAGINYTASLVRVGTAVTCRLVGALGTKSATAGYIELLGIVPTGYRPVSSTVYQLITAKIAAAHGARTIWVGTGGEIRMYADSALNNIGAGSANTGIDTAVVLTWVTS